MNERGRCAATAAAAAAERESLLNLCNNRRLFYFKCCWARLTPFGPKHMNILSKEKRQEWNENEISDALAWRGQCK